MKISKRTLVMVCLLAVGLYAIAGDLDPPGPPNSTMKTLDEVEPRIPIPGSSIAAATYTISSPGSYYLTGDRYCSEHGIEVMADNVTIDLMGYSLVGSDTGATNSGVYIYMRSNVEVRNGTIRNFGNSAVYAVSSNKNIRVIDVRALLNGNYGFFLMGNGHLVKDCIAADNVQQGLRVTGPSMIVGNVVYGNQNGGIVAFDCLVRGNTSFENVGVGISGIASTVIDNHAP